MENYLDDTTVLYQAYQCLANGVRTGSQGVSVEIDKKNISGLTVKASYVAMCLGATAPRTTTEICKDLRSAKGIFVQYHVIKHRHPGVVGDSLDALIDKMIKAVCRHEAEMISSVKLSEEDGNLIDIYRIFSEKKNYKQLGTVLARDIVKKAVNDGGGFDADLEPENQKHKIDKSTITVFLDESIHNRMPFGEGGNYSYIICWGKVKSERKICDEIILAQGVDYVPELKSTVKLTEIAIGRVLIKLAYDYGYHGSVHIYTDNQSSICHWQASFMNARISEQFSSVKVSFIPRLLNTKADALCRERMILDIPMVAYYTVLNKSTKYDKYREKIEGKENVGIKTSKKSIWQRIVDCFRVHEAIEPQV